MKREYQIEPLGRRPIEDWPRGCSYKTLVYNRLYRISDRKD